jgi:uracil phosphoribosyltransferase
MRDVNIQSDRLRFRTNLEKIGELFAYEISKQLRYTPIEVETPLGISKCYELADEVVIAGILRAGLPMLNGMLRIMDHAEGAFISAYRQHHKDGTFEVNLQYVTSPDISGKVLIMVDPMLATGSSIETSLEALRAYGEPSHIHIVSAIASTPGINYIKRLYKKAELWIGAQDDELTARSYIVPGLGDAGDLSYGSKLQD